MDELRIHRRNHGWFCTIASQKSLRLRQNFLFRNDIHQGLTEMDSIPLAFHCVLNQWITLQKYAAKESRRPQSMA
jgi:hypothetical protein